MLTSGAPNIGVLPNDMKGSVRSRLQMNVRRIVLVDIPAIKWIYGFTDTIINAQVSKIPSEYEKIHLSLPL